MSGAAIPGREFFGMFLPAELRLVQRRALGFSGGPPPNLDRCQLGLYLLRALPAPGVTPPSGEAARYLEAHLHALLSETLRDSDIAGRLGPLEMLGVVRDLDGEQAFQVAHRLLQSAGRSELLRGAGLWVRVGYLVYPLTAQPDFPPAEWDTLVKFARWMAGEAPEDGPAIGRGVIRGTLAVQLPELDLVAMARSDLDGLVHAGLVRIQRIHLLPGF